MENKQRYIIADLYQNDLYKPCALGGISSKFKQVFVPVDGGNYTYEQAINNESKLPILSLGIAGDRTHLRPSSQGSWAFGGSFVYCSDTRFRNSISDRPIHLHDRDMDLEKRNY